MSRGISTLNNLLVKAIETVFSAVTSLFPKSIHACTWDGFLLKIEAFIFAFTLKQAFI